MHWKKIAVVGSMLLFVCAGSVLPSLAASVEPSANTKSAVVMIAVFNADGKFTGWGSGFYVDDNIVVTNKHVIEGNTYFRVYPTGADDTIDLECSRTLGLSDVKVNVDDDVAYVRAALDCPHGTISFASADPRSGDAVSVLGYPFKGTFTESLHQSRTTGSVIGKDSETPWLLTSAFVDVGNSGGPVVEGDTVVGVVVAKLIDAEGKFISGLFVPVSQVVAGLERAGDSTFGYTPQNIQNHPIPQVIPHSDADCALILGDGGELADDSSCRCKAGFERDITGTMCLRIGQASSSSVRSSSSSSSSSAKPRSSSSSSAKPTEGVPSKAFQKRTCDRVMKWYRGNTKMIDRINVRLQKRFGFAC